MEIKKQLDVNDCGIAIIQAIYHDLYDKWIDNSTLKTKAKMNKKGINIENLIQLGKEFAIEMEAFKGKGENLFERKKQEKFVTLIQNKNENHFVIFQIQKKKVKLWDPVDGEKKVSEEEFLKMFNNIIITFKQGEKKVELKKIKSPFVFLLKQGHLITIIIFLILTSIGLSFVSSVFMKTVLDYVIPGKLEKTFVVLIIAFAWIGILRIAISFLSSYFSKKMSLIIENDLKTKYFWKIKNAPLKQLNKINSSDHIRRFSLIESCAEFISNALFTFFSKGVTFIFAMGILIWISSSLFGLAFASGAFLALVTFIFNLFVKNKYDLILNSQLAYMVSSIDKIMSLEEIKNASYFHFLDQKHKFNYLKYKKTSFSIWKIRTFQNIVSELFNVIFPLVLTYFSVKYIFNNRFSIGSMVMFISIYSYFIGSLESITYFWMSYDLSKKNLKLLTFITNLEDEKTNFQGAKLVRIMNLKLQNFTFGYDQTILNIKDFQITENLHITGENGKGKSTLINVLGTLYFGKGKFLVNDLDLKNIDIERLRENIFLTKAKTYMPTTSIYEYITNNQQESREIFNQNIINYNLNKLMEDLNISFEMEISNNGANLSSGQRQMVNIMKLFAKKYQLILIDEGLENIDLKKVNWLSKAICQFQNEAMFIEVSHSEKYLAKGKEVNVAQINQN